MKELPYFRFTPSEWQNGKISLEDFELQGYFINVCSYYWISDCSITRIMLEKKFKSATHLLEMCLELEIFQHDLETDFISISFLNVQFDERCNLRKQKQLAGSKGGTQKKINCSSATLLLQQNDSKSVANKNKNKNKNKKENKNIKEVVDNNITWRNDFQLYLSELRNSYKNLQNDISWIKEKEKFNPGVDILLTLEKACVEFWATEAGWEHKKKAKSKDINWKSTLTTAISQKQNKVYAPNPNIQSSGNNKNGQNLRGTPSKNTRGELEAFRDLSAAILQEPNY